MTNHGANLQIRLAEPRDAELVATLIEELNLHQHEPTGHVTPEAVRRDGFGAAPEFQVMLAEIDGIAAGYALYHPSWSTEFGERGLYIYDLFVRENARGHGVGRALMAAVARLAKTEGRSFLWWCSKDWNREAQAFYKGLGAVEETIKAHAIFGEPFEILAAGEHQVPQPES
jgi:GNAT superfamily N-acetyltransferase